MALKLVLDSLDGVDEATQKLYKEKDGKFHLQVEGLPDVSKYEQRVTEMDAKITELLDEKKKAAKRAEQAEEAARKAAEEKANKEGDTEALNKSWQAKLDKAEKQAAEQIEGLTKALETNTIESEALKLATTLAVPKSADVLMPHIRSRLKMEIKDGKAQAVVLDKDGKPSALSVEELGKEIAGDERFAPVIVGSNASGGGANGSGGGAAKQKTVTRPEFDNMTHAERAEFSKDGGRVVND